MAWHARLRLDVGREGGRSVARFEHEGPLRILQTLYPEGDAVCHNVIVHPPSGLVAGDELDVRIHVGEGAHGLATTPGAARFYRSEGPAAVQRTRIDVAAGGRFEWLPLEAICYSGANAENHLHLQLQPGGECLGWDVAALGLPTAGQPFVKGSLLQQLSLGKSWLDRGRIDAANTRLMDGPLGMAGHRCLGTLFFACGAPIQRDRKELALAAARELIEASSLAAQAGATSPCDELVVVRVLAPLVEPAMELLQAIRAQWRPLLWEMAPVRPRLWAM